MFSCLETQICFAQPVKMYIINITSRSTTPKVHLKTDNLHCQISRIFVKILNILQLLTLCRYARMLCRRVLSMMKAWNVRNCFPISLANFVCDITIIIAPSPTHQYLSGFPQNIWLRIVGGVQFNHF